MPLFNESLESIAQAVVTVKRALKAGVIEEENYRGFSDYLAKRAKDFKIKKSHLTRANKDLDEELLDEELEFFVEEGDALYKMAEDLLDEHEKDDVKKVKRTADEIEQFRVRVAAEVGLSADERAECDTWLDEVREQVKVKLAQAAACAAWMKMDDKERAAMAALASAWQESR